MRPRWLAGGVLLVAALACTSGEPVVEPEPEPGFPAPAPPDAGRFEVAVSGASKLDTTGGRLTCRSWGDVLHVRIGGETDEGHIWNLYLEEAPDDGGRPDRIWLVVKGHPWGDFDAKTPIPGLEWDGTTVTFDVSLPPRKARGGPVQLTGSAHCPDPDQVLDVPQGMVERVEELTGGSVRRYATFDFGRARDQRAISVLVPTAAEHDVLLEQLRRVVGPGWAVWQGTRRDLGVERDEHDEIVIGPATEPAHVVRLAHVDPVNHGLTTEDVAQVITDWDGRYGVEVWQADTESMLLELQRLPESEAEGLAAEVHALCPDVVEQQLGSLDALNEQLRKTRTLVLWWD